METYVSFAYPLLALLTHAAVTAVVLSLIVRAYHWQLQIYSDTEPTPTR